MSPAGPGICTLVPSWWCCLGKFRGCGLAGGNVSLGVGSVSHFIWFLHCFVLTVENVISQGPHLPPCLLLPARLPITMDSLPLVYQPFLCCLDCGVKQQKAMRVHSQPERPGGGSFLGHPVALDAWHIRAFKSRRAFAKGSAVPNRKWTL